MHIAVCDDNKLFLEGFEEQLRELSIIEAVFSFSDYNAFLFSVDDGKQYDAVLMDIDWNRDLTGMDIAEEIYKLNPRTKIIFVTGNSDRFSQQIFLCKANLSGYLTKPVNSELLYANLKKIADTIPYEAQPTLVLSQRGMPISISAREIFYIESRGHTVEVHTSESTIRAYERLEVILEMLPAGFCRCHKSYIVNMNCIRRFESNDVLLKNGESIPVSRARYAETKEAYFSFMGRKF